MGYTALPVSLKQEFTIFKLLVNVNPLEDRLKQPS